MEPKFTGGEMSTCKYYRESEIYQYTPECTGQGRSVHPSDIEGNYCQFCGDKIDYKEDTEVPASTHPFHGLEVEIPDPDSRCENCGGNMEWCDSCCMWTATCCEEYGTCECS